MKKLSIWSAALSTCAMALAISVPAPAQAQAWPSKTLTLVIPFAAGGPTDVMGRTLSVALTKALGQTVVVENKVGAGGTIGAGHVAKSAPDGYTFFLHHNGMASSTALYRKLAFNPLTDFEYVSQVADVPMTMLARKDFPANTFPEMMVYVKANAAKINLANAGLGAVSHLCGMLFQQALGVDLQTIPFQGTAPALNALLGGQVDVMCDQTTQTIPHIKAGSVKFYGVTTKQRIKALQLGCNHHPARVLVPIRIGHDLGIIGGLQGQRHPEMAAPAVKLGLVVAPPRLGSRPERNAARPGHDGLEVVRLQRQFRSMTADDVL